jgi:two-component system response regulator QseB
MQILLVEDDALLGDGISRGLTLLGFDVTWCESAERAEALLQANPFSVVVLDLGLPKVDGLSQLKQWRAGQQAVPVVVLTARDAVEHKIDVLNAGADDYLVKPVALDELVARLRAVVRRSIVKDHPIWQQGALSYNSATTEVLWEGKKINLTKREKQFLVLLLQNPNRVVRRTLVTETLYGSSDTLESNALDVHVHNLRKKIHPKIVLTLRGAGYALGLASIHE